MVQNKHLFTTNKQNQIDKVEKLYIFCDVCCNLKLKNMHKGGGGTNYSELNLKCSRPNIISGA